MPSDTSSVLLWSPLSISWAYILSLIFLFFFTWLTALSPFWLLSLFLVLLKIHPPLCYSHHCVPQCQWFYPPSHLSRSFSRSLTRWCLFQFLLYLIILISLSHLWYNLSFQLTMLKSQTPTLSVLQIHWTYQLFSVHYSLHVLNSIHIHFTFMSHIYTNAFSDIFNSIGFFLFPSYSAGKD